MERKWWLNKASIIFLSFSAIGGWVLVFYITLKMVTNGGIVSINGMHLYGEFELMLDVIFTTIVFIVSIICGIYSIRNIFEDV